MEEKVAPTKNTTKAHVLFCFSPSAVVSPALHSVSTEAEVDNILLDPHNSSHHTKAEFNNCFTIHSKIFLSS